MVICIRWNCVIRRGHTSCIFSIRDWWMKTRLVWPSFKPHKKVSIPVFSSSAHLGAMVKIYVEYLLQYLAELCSNIAYGDPELFSTFTKTKYQDTFNFELPLTVPQTFSVLQRVIYAKFLMIVPQNWSLGKNLNHHRNTFYVSQGNPQTRHKTWTIQFWCVPTYGSELQFSLGFPQDVAYE